MLEGKDMVITATVQNMGNGTAENVTVHIYMNDMLQSTKTFLVLLPLQSQKMVYTSTKINAGTYNILVEADPSNLIEETNETNNNATSSAEVQTIEDWIVLIKINPDTILQPAIAIRP